MRGMQPAGHAGSSILVVEDDVLFRRQVVAQLERLGVDVTAVGSVAEVRALAGQLSFDVVLLDVHLPDGSGLEVLRDRVWGTNAGVIVMTADGGVSGAVEAMRLGAMDYLAKPFDLAELPLVIQRLQRGRQQARLEEHRSAAGAQLAGAFHFGGCLSGLKRMLERILEADARLGSHLPPVLIQGETGTGKTTIARWIHHRGPRAGAPLVEMNCSAVPETLAESELFGHERGAFTDARAARMGLFEAADGGTLFLDELPSLSQSLQAKVLKALEDHRIRRVGGRREIPVDVRILAATSEDLRELVKVGRFREDLLHRLDLYRVLLPPLRERREDLVELAEQVLGRLSRKHRLPGRRLGGVARERLLSYAWPGNVRELAHELERALVFEEGPELTLSQLESGAGEVGPVRLDETEWFHSGFVFPAEGFDLELAIERLIQHALRQAGNNVSAAARLLGVTRDYVRYRLAGRKTALQGADPVGADTQVGGGDGGAGPGEGRGLAGGDV